MTLRPSNIFDAHVAANTLIRASNNRKKVIICAIFKVVVMYVNKLITCQ